MRKSSKWAHNPAHNMLRTLGWKYLDAFDLHGTVVLRHSKQLQMKTEVCAGNSFSAALQELAARCAELGNHKITGAVKVVEHCRLNGGELMHVLHREHLRRMRSRKGC